jgi:signal transduction histidine kinase
LVKRCLDLHQGQIIVESKVNLGATFTVQIPQNISTQNALYQLIDGRESFN